MRRWKETPRIRTMWLQCPSIFHLQRAEALLRNLVFSHQYFYDRSAFTIEWLHGFAENISEMKFFLIPFHGTAGNGTRNQQIADRDGPIFSTHFCRQDSYHAHGDLRVQSRGISVDSV